MDSQRMSAMAFNREASDRSGLDIHVIRTDGSGTTRLVDAPRIGWIASLVIGAAGVLVAGG